MRKRIVAGAVLAVAGTIIAVPAPALASPDYGPAAWVPASTSNYTAANREADYNIQYIVIHTTQGSYQSTINWFQNPAAQVSAHYVVSQGGAITQMVRDHDIAWHAGNWTYNTQSIGIEHEGFVDQPGWATEAMYQASAALARTLADRYGIPKDRNHIIGHVEVPGATHTDPGPYWDWAHYMALVNNAPAWSSTVDNSTAGRFSASANWGTSTYSAQRFGADYRFANPQAISDAAWYKFNIPATASYRVEAWYPSNAGYNDSAPYVIVTTGGNQPVHVDQRANGGRWVTLGTFSLAAGDYNAVGVSRWASGTGYVIADAVRLTRV
jgi:N-acetyl-anhydromuramyl-L-alanine amidase AmpD